MSRGGRREGAGRPFADRKRVQIQLYVEPETKEIYRQLRAQGIDVTACIEPQIVAIWDRVRLRDLQD